MKKYLILLYTALLTPVFASAQLQGTQRFIFAASTIVGYLVTLVAGIALLVFFWGLAKFITKSGGEAGIEEGKNIMKWGLIALFVMMSVWGIIGFMQRELNLPNTVGQQVTPVPTRVPGNSPPPSSTGGGLDWTYQSPFR